MKLRWPKWDSQPGAHTDRTPQRDRQRDMLVHAMEPMPADRVAALLARLPSHEGLRHHVAGTLIYPGAWADRAAFLHEVPAAIEHMVKAGFREADAIELLLHVDTSSAVPPDLGPFDTPPTTPPSSLVVWRAATSAGSLAERIGPVEAARVVRVVAETCRGHVLSALCALRVAVEAGADPDRTVNVLQRVAGSTDGAVVALAEIAPGLAVSLGTDWFCSIESLVEAIDDGVVLGQALWALAAAAEVGAGGQLTRVAGEIGRHPHASQLFALWGGFFHGLQGEVPDATITLLVEGLVRLSSAELDALRSTESFGYSSPVQLSVFAHALRHQPRNGACVLSVRRGIDEHNAEQAKEIIDAFGFLSEMALAVARESDAFVDDSRSVIRGILTDELSAIDLACFLDSIPERYRETVLSDLTVSVLACCHPRLAATNAKGLSSVLQHALRGGDPREHVEESLRGVVEVVDVPVHERSVGACIDLGPSRELFPEGAWQSTASLALMLREVLRCPSDELCKRLVQGAIARTGLWQMLDRDEVAGERALRLLDSLLNDREPRGSRWPSSVHDVLADCAVAVSRSEDVDQVSIERSIAKLLRRPRETVRDQLSQLRRQVGTRRVHVRVVKGAPYWAACSSLDKAHGVWKDPAFALVAVADPEARTCLWFGGLLTVEWLREKTWVLLDLGLPEEEEVGVKIMGAVRALASKAGVAHLIVPMDPLLHRPKGLARIARQAEWPVVAGGDLRVLGHMLAAVWEVPLPHPDGCSFRCESHPFG